MKEYRGEGDICITIPALNEGSTIQATVRDFLKIVDSCSFEVLVVDGHSSDNTMKLAEEAGAFVISQKKGGKGAAMIEAVDKREKDVFIFVDGDGTYLPLEFESIAHPVLRGEADMVIGSRFKGKIEKGAIRPLNFLGNKFFSLVTKIIFNTDISDIFSGYRAVKRELLQEIELRSCRFEVEAEMTVKAIAKGFRVLEVPITYLRRRGSSTKLSPFKDGFCILRTFFIEVIRGKFST